MSSLRSKAQRDPWWIQAIAFSVTFGFLGLVVVVPIASVFVNAFAKGVGPYWEAISHPDTLAALRMTLLAAASRCLSTPSAGSPRRGS